MRSSRPLEDLADVELEISRLRSQLATINVQIKDAHEQILAGDPPPLARLTAWRTSLIRADARLDTIHKYAKENR